MNTADIVISLNGRDAGKTFVVIDTQDEHSLIADGKRRRLEKPKKKKNKHLKFESKQSGITGEKLKKGEKVTNSDIRSMLAQYIQSKEQAADETESVKTTETKTEAKGGVTKCRKTT